MVEEDVKVAPGHRTRQGLGENKVLAVSVHPLLQTGPPSQPCHVARGLIQASVNHLQR